MTTRQDNAVPSPVARQGGRVRARLLLLLAVLGPLNAYWLAQSEVFRYAGHPTTTSLFYNVIFWLFLLAGANQIAERLAPRAVLWRGELLTIYVVLQLMSALGSHDTAEVLLPILAYSYHYADKANSWADILLPRLPPWLVVTDTAALDNFYNGHSTLYLAAHLGAWSVPVLMWTGFLGTLAGVMLCLNILLRRQWTERERLPFPLIQLPLEMTVPRAPLFRNKTLWAGFAAAVLLQLWNGLAFLIPTIPPITVKYTDMGTAITGRPWSAIGWLPVSFYPFAVALGVLLPTDFLFSSWFFFWFWKAQAVASAALAWDATPGFPYVTAQALGGYLAVALTVIWGARRQFGRVLRSAWSGSLPSDSDGPPRSYRGAVAGVVGGMTLIFAFCLFAGMTPWVVVVFFLIYFAIALAITRMRGELGPPVHDLHQSGPDTLLPQILGPTNLDQQNLAVFGLFWGFNRAYRSHPMPVQLEAFKIEEQARLPEGLLVRFLLVAGFAGPLCAFWALLHLGYIHGAATAAVGPPNVLAIFGGEAWTRYTNQVRVPQPPQPPVGLALLAGMGFGLLLSALRVRIVGFPFHPIGFAVASSWGMNVLWVPMLLAWTIKVVILRYGGLALYRRCLPFCYGVILGECVAGSLWSLFGIATGISTYAFWP